MKRIVLFAAVLAACSGQENSELFNQDVDSGVHIGSHTQAMECSTECPAGPEGPEGPQGVEGPQGEPGVEGSTGTRGAQGERGFTGTAGPVGPVGPAGLVGPVGASGPVGPMGPVGPQGTRGPTGLVGAAGPQGTQGDQGPQGQVGSQGPSGPKGDVGTQGIQGVQGPVGPAGPAIVKSRIYQVTNAVNLSVQSPQTTIVTVGCSQPTDVLLNGGCNISGVLNVYLAESRAWGCIDLSSCDAQWRCRASTSSGTLTAYAYCLVP